MAEQKKITDRATELAEQAAAAAGPLAAQAKEKAAELAEKAKPLAAQAKEKAAELAEKAKPIAAERVGSLGENLDKATKGKYSSKISSFTSKLERRLRPEPAPRPDVAPTDGTQPGATDAAPGATQPNEAAKPDGPQA